MSEHFEGTPHQAMEFLERNGGNLGSHGIVMGLQDAEERLNRDGLWDQPPQFLYFALRPLSDQDDPIEDPRGRKLVVAEMLCGALPLPGEGGADITGFLVDAGPDLVDAALEDMRDENARLLGFGISCEAWSVNRQVDDIAEDDDEWAGRLHEHPDRKEIRMMVAVDIWQNLMMLSRERDGEQKVTITEGRSSDDQPEGRFAVVLRAMAELIA